MAEQLVKMTMGHESCGPIGVLETGHSAESHTRQVVHFGDKRLTNVDRLLSEFMDTVIVQQDDDNNKGKKDTVVGFLNFPYCFEHSASFQERGHVFRTCHVT